MINTEYIKDKVTVEQVMLGVFLIVSLVFLIEPIVEDYPDDARVFPQLVASVVFIGSGLLLAQNYLPGPIQKFATENVAITGADETELESQGSDQMSEEEAGEAEKKDTLGAEYGYEVDETFFMVSTAILYFIAGWSAGFLFVTPIYILAYTLWFRVNPVVSVLLAIAGTAIIYLFMTYLILPFDQGHIFDFSPLLPVAIDGTAAFALGGEL